MRRPRADGFSPTCRLRAERGGNPERGPDTPHDRNEEAESSSQSQPQPLRNAFSSARSGAAGGRNRKRLRERASQCGVDLPHARGDTELGERGHAVLGDPARNDAAVMLEFGVNIERDSMISDPLTHADADRGDLFLFPRGPHDPYADAAVAPFAAYL